MTGKKRMVLMAMGLLGISWSMQAQRPSPFVVQSRPETAQVTMLAVSSSSRQSFAGNQEVYLANLATKTGKHDLVRIIDQYPGYGLPLRDSVLRAQTLLTMRVTREPECDVPGSQIFLAPSEAVIFNGAVRDSLHERAGDLVPCYRALHSTVRIAKVK